MRGQRRGSAVALRWRRIWPRSQDRSRPGGLDTESVAFIAAAQQTMAIKLNTDPHFNHRIIEAKIDPGTAVAVCTDALAVAGEGIPVVDTRNAPVTSGGPWRGAVTNPRSIDRAAFDLAIAIARRAPVRRKQIDGILAAGQNYASVGRLAVPHCQTEALGLMP